MHFHKIYIELTNRCGRNCSFCVPSSRARATLSPDQFEEILEQIKPYTKEIAYHLLGDPLILDDFSSYLDLTHKHGLRGNLVTSGYYINKHDYSTLMHPALKQINISLNSFEYSSKAVDNKRNSKKDEQEAFIGEAVESYLEPILSLCQKKREDQSDLFINFRILNHDYFKTDSGSKNSNKKYGNNLDSPFHHSSDVDATDTIKNKIENESRIQNMILEKISAFFHMDAVAWAGNSAEDFLQLDNRIRLHQKKLFDWPSLNSPEIPDGFCHGLSSHFGILSDGKVVPCCLEGYGIINLGNIFETQLSTVLLSDRSRKIRTGFKQGKPAEALCKRCPYRMRFL